MPRKYNLTVDRPCAEAWDFEGQTIRISTQTGNITIDTGRGTKSSLNWSPQERDLVQRFMALDPSRRLPHVRCSQCKINPAYTNGLKLCIKCRNIRDTKREIANAHKERAIRGERYVPEEPKVRVKAPDPLPYSWRNCRPGSMSEALRIDTGGDR